MSKLIIYKMFVYNITVKELSMIHLGKKSHNLKQISKAQCTVWELPS